MRGGLDGVHGEGAGTRWRHGAPSGREHWGGDKAYPRWFEVEADYAQEAAEMARTQLAADETIDELWVSNPNGGADVFDRQADFLRHEETMPLRGHDR